MKKINFAIKKIIFPGIILFLSVSLAGCTQSNAYPKVPKIKFEYEEIKTEFLLVDNEAPKSDLPQVTFNCKMVIPKDWVVLTDSYDTIKVGNNVLLDMSPSEYPDFDTPYYIKIRDLVPETINYDYPNDFSNYYDAIISMLAGSSENIESFLNQKYEIIDSKVNTYKIENYNVKISYYTSDKNKLIAAISESYNIQNGEDEDGNSTYQSITYFREDIPNISITVGDDGKVQNPSSNYGLNIINSVKIIDRKIWI